VLAGALPEPATSDGEYYDCEWYDGEGDADAVVLAVEE